MFEIKVVFYDGNHIFRRFIEKTTQLCLSLFKRQLSNLSTFNNIWYTSRIQISNYLCRSTGAEAYGRTDGRTHSPRPTFETLRPLFPRFRYLRPGVTDDCLETRGPWFDAVRGVCCDKLCKSCSLVCGVPCVRCSFVLWNSSMQSRLAIGAL